MDGARSPWDDRGATIPGAIETSRRESSRKVDGTVTETPLQVEAFEFYRQVKSFRETGKHFKKHRETIHAWSKKFNWQERVLEKEEAEKFQIIQAAEQVIIRTREKFVEMAVALAERAHRRILGIKKEEGEELEPFDDPHSVMDLETLQRIFAKATGGEARGQMEEAFERIMEELKVEAGVGSPHSAPG